MKKENRISCPVVYHNDFNMANLSKLSVLENNLLFTIFKGMAYRSKFVFDIDKLCLMASCGSPIRKDRIEGLVRGLIKNVFHSYFVIRTERKEMNIHLFHAINFVLDSQKQIVGLEVELNEQGRRIIHDLGGNFTLLDLEAFKKIQSAYIKTIFRLLSQYKSKGFMKMRYGQFKEILGIPKGYQQPNINERILKPSVEILSEYFKGLKYELVKENREYSHIIYKFKPIAYKTKQDIAIESIELKSSDKRQIFMLNTALKAVDALNPSAEQAKISAQIIQDREKVFKKYGRSAIVTKD